MRFKDKTEARVTNSSKLIRPKGVSDEQWTRALDLYEVARKKGDKFPELTVAQAALETGWFKHMSGNYNYFGQKASKSQKGTNKITSEYTNNRKFKANEKFRDYDSLEQSMDDRMRKWGSKYANSKTINEAIGKIWEYDPNTGQGKGYATDINYDVKLGKILRMMGVDANTEVKERREDDGLLSLDALNFQQLPEMARDNTAVANRKLIEPLVINGLDTPENDTKQVADAKDTIKEEETKFNFIQRVMEAARVDFVEPVASSFQDGGEVVEVEEVVDPKQNELDFLNELNKLQKQEEEDELARVYRRSNSRVKNALKFRRAAGKRVNKSKLA